MTDVRTQSLIVDLKGHFRQKKPERHEEMANLFMRQNVEQGLRFSRRFASDMSEADGEVFVGGAEQCSLCGEYVSLRKQGNTIYASTTCSCAECIPEMHVTLDVPSGTIVFANDLRDLVVVKEPRLSVNTLRGKHLLSQAYADVGMVHIFVGNTCPSVYKTSDGLVVARLPYDGDLSDGEGGGDEFKIAMQRHGCTEKVGWICTDLWWFSAMDKDHFLKRCEIEEIDPQHLLPRYFEVSVEPATYSFSIEDNGTEGIEVFSRATKLAERKALVLKTLTQLEEFDDALFDENPVFVGTQHIRYLLTEIGNGYHWIRGNVIDQDRNEDAPFRNLETESYGHPRIAEIPISDHLAGVQGDCDSPHYPGIIGRAPLAASPYWLALCMIFAKSVAAGPLPRPRYAGDNQKQVRDVLRRSLDMHCEIADARGLWDDLHGGLFDFVLTKIGSKVLEIPPRR